MVFISMSPSQISNNLYVGDIDDVQNGDTSDFDTIVGVCQDDCSDNVSCEYHHFNLSDGEPIGKNPGEFTYELFSEAVETVIKHRIMRKKVLVHCHAGISRSATVATTAYAVLNGLPWEDAFEEAEKRRPNINPEPSLEEFGRRFIDEQNGGD